MKYISHLLFIAVLIYTHGARAQERIVSNGIADPLEFEDSGVALEPLNGQDEQALTTEPIPYGGEVPTDVREKVMKLFLAGNRLFDEEKYVLASAKYQEALTKWDNPNIHHNLMVCLNRMDKVIPAYWSAEKAFTLGKNSTMPESQLLNAKEFYVTLHNQMSWLRVENPDPETRVHVNGTLLLDGAGSRLVPVLPGPVQLAYEREHHITVATTKHLARRHGMSATVEKMMHVDDQYEVVRRWPSWRPWALAGAGVALLLAGGTFQWRSGVNKQLYTDLSQENCPPPGGCFPDEFTSEMQSARSRFTGYSYASAGSYGVGAGAVLAGLTLAYFNRGRTVAKEPPKVEVHIIKLKPAVVSADGVAITVRF